MMRLARFGLVPAALLLGALGCSIKNVKVREVSLCHGRLCETVGPTDEDRLLTSLHQMLARAEGTEAQVSLADPKSGLEIHDGVRFFVQGGFIPAAAHWTSLSVGDVLYLDREKREIRFNVNFKSTFLGVPVLCASGVGFLRVNSPNDVTLTHSNLCSWLIVGTSAWKGNWKIDRVDLEAGLLSGHYSIAGGGPLCFGGGKGYSVVHFQKASERAAPKAAPPTAPRPKPVDETVELISQIPDLSFKTKLEDDGGDLIMDGGEKVSLSVAVENMGRFEAASVRVVLSGTAELVAALGAVRELKGIRPGASATATFRARLPRDLPSKAAELRVEVLSGQTVSAGAKTLRVAMRQAAKPEAVEVLSEVDVDDIPPRIKTDAGEQNAALVIGISRYRDKSIPGVRYAGRDAEVMAKYLENLGGIPPQNIKVLADDGAVKSDIEAYISDWLPRRIGKESTVFVYFAGHGSPGPRGEESYLVPYEGRPDFPSQLLPMKQLYAQLEKLQAKRIVVMLDSCFSGAQGRGVVGEGTRPLVSRFEGPSPDAGSRLIVIAGATGAQVTSDLDRAKHGLFTYYMLRGMRGEGDVNGDGAVALGELYAYVRAQVAREAASAFNRDQTPMLLPAQGPEDRLEITLVRRK